jgi:MFS family permease
MASISAFIHWLNRETGLQSVREYGNRDIYLILVTRFLRMFAYGGAALVLAIFLYAQAGVSWKQTGTFMTLTLLGDAAISYSLTIVADKVGRRRVLLTGSLLMTLSGTVFAFSKNYYLLLFAAIFGVISPGAHEVGPFRAVEVGLTAPFGPHFMCSVRLIDWRLNRKASSHSSHPLKRGPIYSPGSLSLLPSLWRLACS